MIEETAVRVEISAARFASQSIFDILRLTVQAMSSQNYGQQSLSALNRQERPLASVDVNKKTLPYIRRQLKQYSVDFSVTKDRDTGQMYLWFKGQDVDRIQTALENCIAERGKERPIPELRDLCDRAAQRVKQGRTGQAGQVRVAALGRPEEPIGIQPGPAPQRAKPGLLGRT